MPSAAWPPPPATRRVSTSRSSSSTDGHDDAVAVGRIVRPHGVRGDVLVLSLSDHPDRFVPGARFATALPGDPWLVVEGVRTHKHGLIVRFSGVDDRNRAEDLVKQTLTIPATERRALDPDEFWPDQLVGLRAERPDGRWLGTVTDVVQGAAQDRLAVTTGSGDIVEVPFVDAIVGDVDAERVVVEPPEGLFAEPPG